MTSRKKQFDPDKRRRQYAQANTELKLIFNLRDLSHIMRALYEGKGSPDRMLILINARGSLTQSELTELVELQPASVSESVRRLKDAGLLKRLENPLDRRTALISLTDAGRQKAVLAQEKRASRHSEMFSCLTDEEKEALLKLLEKLYAHWNARYVLGNEEAGKA